MTNASRVAYRFWTAVVFLAVTAQVGAAGYGAFAAYHKADKTDALTHKQFDHGFNFHIALGYLIFFGSLLGPISLGRDPAGDSEVRPRC